MKYGHTIVYVSDVPATLAIWRRAFGLEQRYLHDDDSYGELETGATVLAFAELEFGRGHFSDARTRAMFDGQPARFELSFTVDDVQGAFDKAVAAGMEAVVTPVEKPWGQVVGWVRDPEGVLVELGSPMDLE